MTMNLKKDFILTSFNHRLFASPAFCGLFLINGSPFGELSYYKIKLLPFAAATNQQPCFFSLPHGGTAALTIEY